MDSAGNIYEIPELSDEEMASMVEEQRRTMAADVARLEGYLKGRAESDRQAHERHEESVRP